MTTWRSLNLLVKDGTFVITIGSSDRALRETGVVKLGDEVSLDFTNGDFALVKIMKVTEDGNTLRGKVTAERFSRIEGERLERGELVEFSKKKIGGIHKN